MAAQIARRSGTIVGESERREIGEKWSREREREWWRGGGEVAAVATVVMGSNCVVVLSKEGNRKGERVMSFAFFLINLIIN